MELKSKVTKAQRKSGQLGSGEGRGQSPGEGKEIRMNREGADPRERSQKQAGQYMFDVLEPLKFLQGGART